MSDQLKVEYDSLYAAANAMSTAGTTMTNLASGVRGNAPLPDDVFGEKGEKIASWYDGNVTNTEQALDASATSFATLAKALNHAAATFALLDATLKHKGVINPAPVGAPSHGGPRPQ